MWYQIFAESINKNKTTHNNTSQHRHNTSQHPPRNQKLTTPTNPPKDFDAETDDS